MDVKLIGFDKAIANLKKGEKSIPRTFFNAMVKATNTVAISERSEAPFVTGTLRRSISTTVEINSFKGLVYADGNQAPYARRVNFGFSGSDSLGRHYHQKPNNFVQRAIDANKGRVRDIFKEAQKSLAHQMATGESTQ